MSWLEDIILERGQPNDDKKQTRGGRGVKKGRNLVDVIYGRPPLENYGQKAKLNFDHPSNLSKALIIDPKGLKLPNSHIWAALGSLNLDQ